MMIFSAEVYQQKNHSFAVNWFIVMCDVNWSFGCLESLFYSRISNIMFKRFHVSGLVVLE